MKRPTASRRTQLLARSALCGVLGAMAIGASTASAQVTGVGTINSTSSNGANPGVASGGGVTDITMGAGSTRSIINWANLTVTPTEALNFYFNNRSDIVVNRVAGSASIDGILNGCMATCGVTGGNIWILSTNGILIGANAQINTGGFLASTGNLTDLDILDGDMNFAFTGAPANSMISVVNGASLNTNGGSLALIAPIVTTAAGSTVTATNGGDVIYGSAQNYDVTFAPTGGDDLDLLTFQVPSQSDGSGGTPGLTLNGTTVANQVFAAIVSKASVASSILLGGNITATTASGENGDIVLSAGSGFTNGVANSPMGFDGSITQNTTSTLTGVNVTMRASDNIVADEINASGRVWLNSEWTSISQTGAITADILRAEAGGDVILTNAGNDFNFLTYIEAQGLNGIDIVDLDGFVINDYIFHLGGGARTASLTALTGSISATGSGVIQVGTLNVSAAGGAINLGIAANNTTNLGTITAGAGNFTYRSLLDVNVAGVITASNVTLSSLAGAITESGGGSILASSLSASASTGLSLSNANNNVSTIGGLVSGSGDVVFAQTNGFQITGAVTAIGQGMSLSSLSGSITQTASGIITTALLNAGAGDDLILDQANVVGGVGNLLAGGGAGDDLVFNSTLGFNISGTMGGDNVSLTSGGSISQGATSRVFANLLTLDAVGGIDLPNFAPGLGNDIDALGLVTTGGAVSIGSISALDLTADIDTDGNFLSLFSQLGLTQSGGVLKASTLTTSVSTGSITLNRANEIDALGIMFAGGTGNLTFRNAGSFTLTGVVDVFGNNLNLISNTGSIVQQSGGDITAANLTATAATGIILGQANDVVALGGLTTTTGNLTFRNLGSIAAPALTTPGTLTLVSDNGSVSQTGAFNAASLMVSGQTGVALHTQVNDVDTILGLTSGAGSILYRDGDGFNLAGNLTSPILVSLLNAAGSITQSAGIIATDLLTATSADNITLNRANQVNLIGSLIAGGDINFFSTLGLTVLNEITGDDVSITSGGTFTQDNDGDITASSLAIGAATGISLTNAGNDVSTIAGLINSGSGGIAFGQAGGYQISGAVSAAGQTVSLSSVSGAIIQNSGSGITASTLNASASGALTLNQGNDVSSLGVISTGGSFLFRDVNGFALTGNVTAANQVVMLAQNGSMTQTGGIITANDINVLASVDVLLGSANQINSISSLVAGRDLLYRQVGDLSVPAINVSGTLSLYSTTGSVTQTGQLIASVLNAGAVTGIDLANSTNAFYGIGDVTNSTSGGISLTSQVGTNLSGDITAAGQAVTLISYAFFQQAAASITAGSLTGSAYTNAIMAGDNDVDAFSFASDEFLTFRDIDGFDIDGAVLGTNVNLISGDAISESGGGAVYAANLSLTAASATLNGANDIDNLGNDTVTGNMAFLDVDGINLTGGITVDGTLTLTAATFVTQVSGGVDVGRLEIDAGTAVSINQASNAIDVLGDVTSTSGSVAIVNNTALADLEIDGDISAAASGQTVFISSLASGLAMTSAASIISGAHVELRGGGDLVLGDIDAGGVLTVVADGGSVSSTAAPTLAAARLTGSATGSFVLTGANIDIDEISNIEIGTVFSITGNNGPLDLAGNITAQTVALGTTGALTQTGGIVDATTGGFSAGGSLTMAASNAVDTVSLNGASVSYTSGGSFAANVVTATGAVSLTSINGNITQTAGTGRIVADSLTASAFTGLEFFGGQNDIAMLAGLSSASGGVTYRDMGGFDITGNITAIGQSVELISDATGADGDDITQSGGVITAQRLNGNSAGDFLLTRANAVTNLGLLNANGDFTYRGAGAVTLVDNLSAGSVLTVISDNNGIMQNGGVIMAQTLNASSALGIGLARLNDVDALGDIDAGVGEFSFRDVDGLDLAGDIAADAAVILQTGGALSQSGGSLTTANLQLFSNSSAILNGANNDIDNLGGSNVIGDLSFSDVDGFTIDSSIRSGGVMTLAAATGDIVELTGGAVDALTLNVTTTTGTIDLGGDNTVVDLGDFAAAGDITYNSASGFTLTGDVTGNAISLTADSGAIVQLSGSIVGDSLYASALTGLNLSSIGNDVDVITGLINLTSGGISYHNSASVSITGAVTAIAQTVNFDVNGDLNQTVAGVITAGRVQGAAMGMFALADAANDVAQLGPISANSISFVTVSGLQLTGALNAATYVELKAETDLTQTAAGTITGNSLRAQADGDIILDQDNDLNTIQLLYSDFGDITYADIDGFGLDASVFGDIWTSGTLTLTAGGLGDIGQFTAGVGAGTLVISAGGYINLTEDNQVTNLGAMTAGAQIYFYDLNDIALIDDITAGGSFNVVSINGAVTQTSGLITATSISGQSANDFTLNNFAANLNSAVSIGGDVSISNTGDIFIANLVQVGAGNSVSLTTSGSIASDVTGRIEAGLLNLSAGTFIQLSSASHNDVDALGAVTAGTSFTFIDDDDFALTGDINIDGGASGTTASLRSIGGRIDQTGGVIMVDGLGVRTQAGADLSGANLVGALEITNGSGDVYFSNAQDLGVVSATSGGLVDIQTTAGRLDILGQIDAGSIVLTGANGAYAAGLLTATGDVTVTAVTGNAMAARIVSGDDVLVQALAGSAQVQDITLYADIDPESDGQNLTITADGDAFLGAASAAGIAGQSLNRISGAGTVSVTSTDGDATVFLSSMDTAVDTLTAGGAAGTAFVVVASGDATLGTVSGYNVSLRAANGAVNATAVALGGGDYTLYGEDFSTGVFGFTGLARDISITDTVGDLTIDADMQARRNLTVDVLSGSLLDGTGNTSLVAGTGGSGDLTIEADNIALNGVGAAGNVTLDAGVTGTVAVNLVVVFGDYNLTGGSFSTGALAPIGFMGGTWTITDGGGFDFSGQTLTYNGSIAIHAADVITGGDVQSLFGSVLIDSLSDIDVEGLHAATGITVDSGNDLIVDSATTSGGDISLTGRSVTVEGFADAGRDVLVTAEDGAAEVESATAGRHIAVAATDGDARLGQAILTGATGDLTVVATNGNAILGAADYTTIGSNNHFERAPGSTGTVSVTATGGGAAVYLDHSDYLDLVEGDYADVTVENGDLTIGVLTALIDDAYAEALDGSLTIGDAAAASGGVSLFAFGGDLTITGTVYGGLGVTAETDGLLDGRLAVSIDTAGDLDLTGGSVLLNSVTADGSISVAATDGDAYVEFANAGGSVQVGALDGDATLRGAEGVDGIAVFATNTATFGADDRSSITGSNYGVTGGGCGCGPGAGIIVGSLNGDVVVNLQSVVGGFDIIGAAIDGDATVYLATGNLAIGDLAAFNIDIEVANGSLETAFSTSSGGNYRLKARDFLGDVLNPSLFSGTLGDYTVTDTLGGLDMTGVSILAQGDVRIDVQNGALTGDARLSSISRTGQGDVTITASSGIVLGSVEADRDVNLNAGTGGVDVASSVTIGRDYTLRGQSFSAAALTPLGAKAGAFGLQTLGNLDYSAGVLGYGGDITLDVSGALSGGDITSATGNILLGGESIDSGSLSAANGTVIATGNGGDIVVASATARGAIDLYTDNGNVTLGAAALLGTGSNTVSLRSGAGGIVTLGAGSPGSIGTGHAFTSAGSSTSAILTADAGGVFVNLDRSDALTNVIGAGDVGITVLNGDFTVGLIQAGGRVDVAGPDGALTIDSFFAATDAGIHGGDVTLTDGEVGQTLTVDATGDIDFRANGMIDVTGEISLAAGGRVSQAVNSGLTATGLTVNAGDAVNLAGVNSVEAIRAVDVATGGFAYRSTRTGGFDIAGAINAAGQTVDLRAENGGISQSGGAVVAGKLTGASDGGVYLAGGNLIDQLGDFANTGGAFLLNVDQALSIVGTVDSAATLKIQSGAMTIASTGMVRSAASGDAVVLASDGVFTNSSGGDGVQAANGRWLIFSQAAGNPAGSTSGNNFGSLDGRSYYGSTYDFGSGAFSTTPNAGNRFVYAYQPTLTVTPINQRLTYDGQIPMLSALIAGLINGDRAADAWSGAPILSGATSKNVGTYGLSAALGSLLSDMNYAFSFGTGTLIIDPKALTGTVNADSRTYDGTTNATGSITLGGVVAGDSVVVTATGFTFADRNAGLAKVVTALGAGLWGADAGNYTLGSVGTAVADILRRSLTGVLAANNKTYDGTTTATGTIGLTGVVAGDLVSANGFFNFADRNAGVAKVVTASGLVLSGADAGNYDLGPISGVADILRRSIGGTVIADNKTYDGSATATGRINLTGIVSGDDIRAGGTLSFDSRNAGVGRNVSAANASLSGVDAGNYTLTGVANGIADILRRAISITANDQSKRFGQGDPGLTYVVAGNSLIAGDVLTGGLIRAGGEVAGVYVIGQGDLAASSNYILTFTPGEFVIQIPPAGGVQSLQMLRSLSETSDFALDRDPSPGLIVDNGGDEPDSADRAGVRPTSD